MHLCWKCGAPLKVTVGQPGGVSKSTRTGREYLMDAAYKLKERLQRNRRFDTVAGNPPWAQQANQAPAVRECAPGQTDYREMNARSDITPQLQMGLVCGGLVAFLGGCVIAWFYWPASRPGVIVLVLGDLVTIAAWLRLSWDMLVLGSDGRLITRKREPDTQPVVAPRTWNVKAEMTEGKHTTRYDAFGIDKAWEWHRFCKIVHFEGKNFSGAEAKRHKVLADWERVADRWINNGWLKPASAGGTPELLGRGRAWVRAYAMTPPEEE